MARVSLVNETDHPELADLIGRIRGARGGRLINIYRLMLHSPALAEAWFTLNQTVRYKTEIDGQCRELAVIRIALLNGVDYVLQAHGPAYALKEGLTPEQVEGLAAWEHSDLFTEKERALLAYVDAVTRDIEVPEPVFAALKPHFNERQIVEATMLISAYNMLTRFLKALKVDPEPSSGTT